MKARIKEKEKETDNKSYQYEIGMLYIQKSAGTVILCDRNSNESLRGICIIPGIGKDYNGNTHYIGEYRADWHSSIQKFEGEIILEQ